jgi:nitrate/nitrite transport system substrate-binding protein
VARKVYQPDIYVKAAKLLIDEGKAKTADFPFGSDGYKPATSAFIDHVAYDGRKPNDYLGKFALGLKQAEKISGAGVVEN